ncbi:MAG: IS1595 family transposase [Pedosphaera sp.]|nr:IS1595 family transposase [Pedosphaera sp.]
MLEFNDRFHDEAACRAYLEFFRWPNGSRCPRCPEAKVWKMKAPFYRCAACGHDFTVTAGTLFADTHLPLRLWFQAMCVCRQSDERGQCVGRPARAGVRQLPYGLELVAQTAAGDGAPRPRRPLRHGGNGRGVYRRRTFRQTRARGCWQGFGADRRASGREQNRPHWSGAGGGCVGAGVGASHTRGGESRQPSLDRWRE